MSILQTVDGRILQTFIEKIDKVFYLFNQTSLASLNEPYLTNNKKGAKGIWFIKKKKRINECIKGGSLLLLNKWKEQEKNSE